MTSARIAAVCLLALGVASAADARSTTHRLKIADVLKSDEYKEKVGTAVAFYFDSQGAPQVAENFGEFATRKTTRSMIEKDEDACQRAMISALVSLRERAEKQGGNAVIHVTTYRKKTSTGSATEYECRAGDLVAHVDLKGTVVRLTK